MTEIHHRIIDHYREKIETKAYLTFTMKEKERANSSFWDSAEEHNADLNNKMLEKRDNPPPSEFSIEEYEKLKKEEYEEQRKLNDDWKDKVPDDIIMMRDEIRYSGYVILGCIALYFSMTISDGDATPLSPLREQIWPLVIVALLLPLKFLVSRQFREVRWHVEEMTAVIYRKSGDCFVVSATILAPGDELVLNSETTWSDGGFHDVTSANFHDATHASKKQTLYWIEVHRGGQRHEIFGEDWNNKRHLLAVIDFLEQKISK